MNSTTGSEYPENIYIHLKLIFAFAAQSSLSKVRNDNVRNAVRTRGTCAVQHPCHIHKPVLGNLYSGTVTIVPCGKTCTNHDINVYYVQLHIGDAILCIINDVMIVLYGIQIVS